MVPPVPVPGPVPFPHPWFSDINVFTRLVSQHMQSLGGDFSNQFSANLPTNLPVKMFCKSVKI